MDVRLPNRPKVILVDDDDALLRALGFSLELEGFVVDKHQSPATVRADNLPKRNACLVFDYYLPGQNGLQLLETLRGHGVTLPAIVITSHARPALRSLAAGIGATIIEKPLIGPALSSEIRSLLKAALAS
jgi:two-component system response regulator FixJ